MISISFIITCKSRLYHVQQTLPLLVQENPDEIIFVDYGCPQGSGKWVEENFPDVKVMYVNDDPGFCISRARNIGVTIAKSEWLCFIDADIKVATGWVHWLKNNMYQGFYYRASLVEGNRDKETWGTVLCTRKAFEAIGGYDEVFRGWGGEDDDFYLRLQRFGMPEASYPSSFIVAIGHDDSLRMLHYQVKNMEAQKAIKEIYKRIKNSITASFGPLGAYKNIALEMRLSLWEQVSDQVIASFREEKSNPSSITIRFNDSMSISDSLLLSSEFIYKFDIKCAVDKK